MSLWQIKSSVKQSKRIRIERAGYVRGIGWENTMRDQAAEYMEYDRDDYYRKNFKEFNDSTLQAEKSYQICPDKWECLNVSVNEGFWLEVW